MTTATNIAPMRSAALLVLLALLLSACSDHGQRLLQLEELERQNRADSVMRNDSLARALCEWFDDHGTANERLRAHYILGRTYADLGEAPAAIAAYMDAADCADTTATDCDYHTLSRVYGQMARLYHQQLLFSHEADAHKQSAHFSFLSNDTLDAIYEMKMRAGAYILLNKEEEAEFLLRQAIELYRRYGYEQKALQASAMLMHIFVNLPNKASELQGLLYDYDTHFALFDEHKNLPPAYRQYFYYKGRYFEMTSQMDSAECYYRKMYHPGMSAIEENPMYKGLLSVFRQKALPDSIAKYTILYCEANDSSLIAKDQTMTAKLTASYNYSRYQREAFENEQMLHAKEKQLHTITTISIALFSVIFLLVYRYGKKQQQKKEELKMKTDELLRLESIHRTVIDTIQEELQATQRDNSVIRGNYAEAQRALDAINTQYNQEKAALTNQIHLLEEKVGKAESQAKAPEHQEQSKLLRETEIFKLVRYLSEKPRRELLSNEFDELETEVGKCFPAFLHDIKNAKGLNKKDTQVAILSAIGLKPAHIQCLTGLYSSQITNAKAKVNNLLFGEKSASTFSNNIRHCYGIYC